jgi:hypothetical protein
VGPIDEEGNNGPSAATLELEVMRELSGATLFPASVTAIVAAEAVSVAFRFRSLVVKMSGASTSC